uniref:AT-rich interactive domain-containing protein 2-like n=1 Tax=Erigeron canadensis TaxID=72917 RepID=UPI001CB9425E|nr:AT-rich interactive domain-containing protein 2-like [Erigeron canadensis]
MSHFCELKDELGGYDRLRCLFNQVVTYFLKGVYVNKDVIRPKLVDGVEVDLFTLFWVVRKNGDYELVSKNELWENVAEECGLDNTHVGSLKSIYIKYLKELDQWLSHEGFKDTTAELNVFEKLDLLFRELRAFNYDMSCVGFETDKKGKCVVVGPSDDRGVESSMECDDKTNLDMPKSGLGSLRVNNANVNDEKFVGLDLNLALTEMGFPRIDNVNQNYEFGDLDLNLSLTDLGFSGNDNVDDNNKIGGLGLEIAKTESSSSRTKNMDDKVEEFGNLDVKRTELSPEIVIKKVDVPRIDDSDDTRVDDKRALLCPTNVPTFQFGSNDLTYISDNDNNTVILAKTIVNNVVSSIKRKKEESLSLSKMLNWLANAARDPHDITIRRIPISSKWKKYKDTEVWKQALVVKETLFAKRNADSGNNVYHSQKNRQMMHPSMYEDDKVPNIRMASKRIRCSQRASVKSCSCPGCKSCSSSRNKRARKCTQILETIETQDDMCEDLETERDIIAAQVPEWTGSISDSNPKWLGSRMWPPPEDKNGKHEMDIAVIGKGRPSSCMCLIPGSDDCVKYHIAESRVKIQHTLGQLFYKWKFDRMGEKATVSAWNLEEETKFKSLVIKARQELTDRSKSRHEIMRNFWRRASESIPSKPKGMLVSYYFNVFVLRRRSYQNRIMPEHIDSDDDEQEVGYENSHDALFNV